MRLQDSASDLNVAAQLATHAKHDGIAIIGPEGSISFAQFFERVCRAASGLIEAGLDLETPVGVAITDETEHLIATMALMSLGVPTVAFPSFAKTEAIAAVARILGVEQFAGYRTDLPDTLKPIRYAAVRGDCTDLPWKSFGRDSPALFRTSSGTTGTPKVFAQSGLRTAIMAKNASMDAEQRRVLRMSTVEYDSTRQSRIAALLAGNTSVFVRDYSAGSLAAACTVAGVTQIHVGTYRLAGLVEGVTAPLPTITSIVTGGSRVSGALRKAVQDRLCRKLFVLYATSEVGAISKAGPDEHAEFPEGVGLPIDGVTVEIVDDEGRPVEPGATGELRVLKAGAPQTYLGGPGSYTFSAGWFRTRDLFSQMPKEPLIFHGRSDDMMILGGINIFASAIEDTLESMPEVAEAVAYPVTSRIHGQIPIAAVVLKPDTDLSSEELIRRCRQALGFNSPRKIFILREIPRTPLGKPLRRELPS